MIKEKKTAVKDQSNIGSALKDKRGSDKRKLLRYYFRNMDVEVASEDCVQLLPAYKLQ